MFFNIFLLNKMEYCILKGWILVLLIQRCTSEGTVAFWIVVKKYLAFHLMMYLCFA